MYILLLALKSCYRTSYMKLPVVLASKSISSDLKGGVSKSRHASENSSHFAISLEDASTEHIVQPRQSSFDFRPPAAISCDISLLNAVFGAKWTFPGPLLPRQIARRSLPRIDYANRPIAGEIRQSGENITE